VKYGLWLRNGLDADVPTALERAAMAEDAGWDGVFVSDSIWEGYSDPFVTLAAVAARTERIALGTWVVPVPFHDPWRLAHQVAGLDQLSGGRVLLGTGLGVTLEYQMFGSEDDLRVLGRRYDEALDVMTALWSGDTVDHEGEFFTLRDARLPILPAQRPRVPILPAAWWPNRAPIRRAARWDGLMPTWPALLGGETGPDGQAPSSADPIDELREMLDVYHELADEPGAIVLPWLRSIDGYHEICNELGVSWLLMLADLSDDEVRAGPSGLI
jgi:alkanesulfonate monooxygenase SsuD/methylene tetrahydromethanopterin reductase-like flavin-dependent oxidoreductase (luciferase family)